MNFKYSTKINKEKKYYINTYYKIAISYKILDVNAELMTCFHINISFFLFIFVTKKEDDDGFPFNGLWCFGGCYILTI